MWSHTDIKILHRNHNNGDNQKKKKLENQGCGIKEESSFVL